MPDALHLEMERGLKRGLLTDILSRNGTEVIAMLLKEYDQEEAKEYWKKEAAEEATSRTLARARNLDLLLISQKRYSELERAAKDPDYQMKLLNEYGI